jgi:hypothetical protein
MKKIFERVLMLGGIFIVCSFGQVFAQENTDFDLPDISVFDNQAPATTPAATPQENSAQPASSIQSAPAEIPAQPAPSVQTAPESAPVEQSLPAPSSVEQTPAVQSAPAVSTPAEVVLPQQQVIDQPVQTQPVSQPTQIQQTYPSVSKTPWIQRGWNVSALGGATLFYGDLGIDGIFPTDIPNQVSWAGSLALEKELFKNMDMRGQLLYGNLKGIKENYATGLPANLKFDATLLEYNLNFKYNVTNAILGEVKPVSLYIYAGMGFSQFRSVRKNSITDVVLEGYGDNGVTKSAPTIETMVPMGVGLEFKLTDNLFANLDVSMNVVNTDKLDAFISPKTDQYQDMYGITAIGITYKFGNRTEYVPPVIVDVAPEVQKSAEKVDSTNSQAQDSINNAAALVKKQLEDATLKAQQDSIQNASKFKDTDVLKAEEIIVATETNVAPETKVEEAYTPITPVVEAPIQSVTTEQGLVYRVQILAVQNQQKSKVQELKNKYKLTDVIYEEKVDSWFKYTVGSFATVQEASNYRLQMVNKGIEGAFVVPYYLGKRITLQKAREILAK